jgi:hypothetical protein
VRVSRRENMAREIGSKINKNSTVYLPKELTKEMIGKQFRLIVKPDRFVIMKPDTEHGCAFCGSVEDLIRYFHECVCENCILIMHESMYIEKEKELNEKYMGGAK